MKLKGRSLVGSKNEMLTGLLNNLSLHLLRVPQVPAVPHKAAIRAILLAPLVRRDTLVIRRVIAVDTPLAIRVAIRLARRDTPLTTILAITVDTPLTTILGAILRVRVAIQAVTLGIVVDTPRVPVAILAGRVIPHRRVLLPLLLPLPRPLLRLREVEVIVLPMPTYFWSSASESKNRE